MCIIVTSANYKQVKYIGYNVKEFHTIGIFETPSIQPCFTQNL